MFRLWTIVLRYSFLFQIEESTNTNLLTLDEIKALVYKKTRYLPSKTAAKAILAEFKDDPSLNRVFPSLNSLAKELEGDHVVIREYLKGLDLVIIVVNGNCLI